MGARRNKDGGFMCAAAVYVRQGRRNLKASLWKAQRGKCPYCPRMLPHLGWPEDAGQLQCTVDHVHPKSKQGSRELGVNLVLSHRVCNMRKSNRSPRPCELIFVQAINLLLEAA